MADKIFRVNRLFALLWLSMAQLVASSSSLMAVDRLAGTAGAFQVALNAAQPGDRIVLTNNIAGGHFRAGLTGVTITSQNPAAPFAIQGGVNGIQLSDATNVTLENIVFEQQTGNGVNIDDGGSFDSPSTGITFRNVTVRDMNAGGNNDGIKLSGVNGFLIDKVTVENWGTGGSAIDPVGSHNGLIQNSVFRHDSGGSSGVRPKGGSKNIAIYANRFDMPGGSGRAIQAGGSTGEQFFRFIDGDSGYEADSIVAAGNLIVDANAAFSFANIHGGVFHHNWVDNARNWAVRILNENQGNSIVDTQNGQFTDSVVEYPGNSWNRAINVGAETLPDTFTIARNQWRNTTGPTNVADLRLPIPETDGQYGNVDVPRSGDQIRWDFDWGHWVVNASQAAAPNAQVVENAANLLVATRRLSSQFSPNQADPLSGEWAFAPLASTSVQLGPQSQQILITPESSALISQVPGDFDRSGTADLGDYALWKDQLGLTGPALADGNGDLVVDVADYTLWRDNLPGTATVAIQVPEPPAKALAVFPLVFAAIARSNSARSGRKDKN